MRIWVRCGAFPPEVICLTDPFADIRPYRDDEVTDVLSRLLGDPELIDSLAKLRLQRLFGVLPGLARWLVRKGLRRQLREVNDVHGMQMVIKTYVERMIESTTGGFSVSGLEKTGQLTVLSFYEQSP